MTIYEAAEKVRQHYLSTINQTTTVTASAIFGICKGVILKYHNKDEASRLDGGYGFLFECRYKDGTVDVTPFI